MDQPRTIQRKMTIRKMEITNQRIPGKMDKTTTQEAKEIPTRGIIHKGMVLKETVLKETNNKEVSQQLEADNQTHPKEASLQQEADSQTHHKETRQPVEPTKARLRDLIPIILVVLIPVLPLVLIRGIIQVLPILPREMRVVVQQIPQEILVIQTLGTILVVPLGILAALEMVAKIAEVVTKEETPDRDPELKMDKPQGQLPEITLNKVGSKEIQEMKKSK